jgi:hypothetical protein
LWKSFMCAYMTPSGAATVREMRNSRTCGDEAGQRGEDHDQGDGNRH